MNDIANCDHLIDLSLRNQMSEGRKMIKLVIVQNIIVPYEVPLFLALAKQPDIDLKVYFCARTYAHRKWAVLESKRYAYEVLPGFTLESQNLKCSFNPAILNRLRKDKPDVIVISGGYNHITMQLAFLFARMQNIPVVYRSDETRDSKNESSWLTRLASPIENYMIRKSRAIICPGTRSRHYHIECGADPEKIFVVRYTTANDDLYCKKSKEYCLKKTEVRRELGIKQERVILFVGQLAKHKGVLYLLEAFREISQELGNTALVLLGDGPLAKQLRNYCHKNNLEQVYFAGFIDGQDKIKYYSISDVFVLPTLKDRWGIVINEAMLCSLPVIATMVTGAASDMIFPGENGFIIGKANSKELYLALKKILSDTRLASKMATNSLKTVQTEFSICRRVESFVSAVKYAVTKDVV